MREKLYKYAPWAVLLVLISLTLFIWQKERALYHLRNRAAFDALVVQTAESIDERIGLYIDAHYGGVGFFTGSNHVDRWEWEQYVTALNLLERYQGINGLGYAVQVAREDLPTFLEEVRRDGHENYALKPPGERQNYFIIKYIEPLATNLPALGFDMGSEETRRAAMEAARDTGQPVISGKIILVQDAKKTPGFLSYVPFYEGGTTPSSVQQRRDLFRGLVYAPFIAKDFIDGLFERELKSVRDLVSLEIHAPNVLTEDPLVYRDSDAESLEDLYAYSKTVSLDMYGQPWVIKIRPRPLFFKNAPSNFPIYVLIAGLCVSFAVFILLISVTRTRNKALKIANEITTELRTSEERFQLAVEASQDGVWDWPNVARDEQFWSPLFRKLLGYPEEELEAGYEAFKSLAHEDDQPLLETEIQRCLSERRPFTIECRFNVGGRGYRWFKVKGNVSSETYGYPIRMTGSVQDVHIAHQLQEELKKKQNQLSLFIKRAPAAIAVLDQDLRYIAYSERWIEDYSIKDDDIIGKRHYEVFPNIPDEWKQIHQHCLQGNTQRCEEDKMVGADGSIEWLRWEIHPWYDEHDDVGGIIMFTEIITQRKQFEEALAAANARMQGILDGSVRTSIIAADTNGIITVFNKGAEMMLGYSAEEVVGKQTPEVFHLPEEIQQQSEKLSSKYGKKVEGFQVFVEAAERGVIQEQEWTYVRKDRTHLSVSLIVSALYSPSGEIVGYLGIATDITERKEVERLKNEFVSVVSHELRTPITSIQGSLGLLQAGIIEKDPVKAGELVDISFENCKRLVRLINDILDIQKIEAGMLKFNFELTNLSLFMNSVLLQNEGLTKQYATEFVLRDTLKEECFVKVDKDRLNQAVTNLLSNAAKFSPDGEVVEVKLEADLNGQNVMIHVSDKGPGIPDEFKDAVFHRFVQVDSSSDRKASGTGLGLNITREIVEHMNGHVGFETEPGRGTTFTITLPMKEEADSATENS